MIMKKFWIWILGAFMLLACGQNKAKIKALDNKAIEVHDDVMPKMGNIIRLKGEIKAKMESLADSAAAYAGLEAAFNQLLEAEQGMKDWMHNYQMPDYKKPMEELLPLAETQLESIEAVKKQMESSIAHAEELLGN
jgi:hypothetical protein